jgi:hypothetical protein
MLKGVLICSNCHNILAESSDSNLDNQFENYSLFMFKKLIQKDDMNYICCFLLSHECCLDKLKLMGKAYTPTLSLTLH